MKRFGLFYVTPTLLLIGAAVLPLVLGVGTLYQRDVLHSHYPLKCAQAEMMGRGELAQVDPFRAGGQPLLGNLNGAPLYPTSLLLRVASPLWTLNAHFWLHWLLAPLAFYWFGRAWGLSRPAAWAAGAIYATSGHYLSQLNLYNLMVGTTLAPALSAAVMEAWRGKPRRWLISGGLWTLLVLGGDPFLALMAFGLALTAAIVRFRRPPLKWWRLPVAFALGTLIAAPQIVATWSILELSFRGYWRYTINAALAQSWDPRSSLELLLPMVFGEPNLGFWGQGLNGGNAPLFFSLYPGLLALGLLLYSGRPRRSEQFWAWLVALGGLLLALGAWNPLVRWLYGLPGTSLLRYPVKFWLLVAVGTALLAGVGFERLLRTGGQSLQRLLALLALPFVAGLAVLVLGTGRLTSALQRVAPDLLRVMLSEEIQRWTWLCLASLGILALGAAVLTLEHRGRRLMGALLLALHVGSQIYLLKPLYEEDSAFPYAEQPALLEHVSASDQIVHGGTSSLFGPRRGAVRELFPDLRGLWLERRYFAELYPFSGTRWGLRYEFNHSPEGLDSFFTVALVQAMKRLDDDARVRVLEASGVNTLILDRQLDPRALQRVELVAEQREVDHTVRVYRLPNAVPPIRFVGQVHSAPDMTAALTRLANPAFDPRLAVVLPGAPGEPAGDPAALAVQVSENEVQHLRATVRSEQGGTLVVQKTYLPIWRATIDGRPAQIEVADIHRMAVKVPAGEHQIRLWVADQSLRLSVAAAVAALLGLLLLESGRPRGKTATP